MDNIPIRANPLDDPLRAQAMCRLMRTIFRFWKLSDEHQSLLLGITLKEWVQIQHAQALPPLMPLALRVAALLRIYHMSGDIYPHDADLAAKWIRRQIFSEPFFGKHPLQFMLMDTTSEGAHELSQTREYLNTCFERWSGLRDRQGKLFYLNDERRMAEELVDTLAHMMLRIQKDWKLSDSIIERMIGLDIPTIVSVAEGKHAPSQKVSAQMRCIACIDAVLWRTIYDEEKISSWMLSANDHALFGGAPPYYLLLSQDPNVTKVVYTYLRNISP